MKHLRFSMLYQHYCTDKESKEEKRLASLHPQKAMKELGITYQHATPQSIADQWWFWNCENVPEPLPPFIKEMDIDPMEYIKFGLNQETAEKIRDYKESNK